MPRGAGLRACTSAALGLVCLLGACVPSDVQESTDTSSADAAAAARRAAAYSANGALTVTETGYGPLAVGMTTKDAAAALGAPPPPPIAAEPGSACGYAQIATLPRGVRVMVVRDTVVRVDVDSGRVATGLGAQIGDAEWRIRDLYGSRVAVQPHKYLPGGHYMIVSPIPPSDTGLRLVFETDSDHVKRYRAGRLPEVMWVEGCS